MSFRVVHLAYTPLAGSPIRIVHALRAHAGVRARLVVLNAAAYGDRTYPGDLVWKRDRDEAMTELAACDVIHLHHWMAVDRNGFGVDLSRIGSREPVIVRQFHTHPETIAAAHGCRAADVVNDPLPQLVLAQFHERFYPRARVVPNLVPLDDSAYRPEDVKTQPVTVFYAPSNDTPAWSSRWDTKGYPETAAMLERLASRTPSVRIEIAMDFPHHECLRRRRASHISIDELVTGSFHLSSLEALAQGVPTFAFLDQRTLWLLEEMTGTSRHPWRNVRLEEAEGPLGEMARSDSWRAEVGRESRNWMERHWNDAEMVRHYMQAYDDALDRPGRFGEPRFDVNDTRAMWLVRERDDALWEQRRLRETDKRADQVVSVAVAGSRFDVLDHWLWPKFREGFEPQTYEVFRHYLRGDRSYIDIGTWVGPTLLYAASIGCRHIWGVEANPLNYAMVRRNCELNKLLDGRASLFHLCICDREGTVSFGNDDGSETTSSASSLRGATWQVQATTLSQFIESNGIHDASLIKIDIEGAELLVLDDIERLSDRPGTVVHLSLHPPFWEHRDAAARRVREVAGSYNVLGSDLKPLALERLEAMMLSDEPKPEWGTPFGNFFEIVLESADSQHRSRST